MCNKFMLLLILSISALYCTSPTQKTSLKGGTGIVDTKSIIPLDAIPIKVENGRFILPVIFNDSVSTYLILDNGTSNLCLDKTFVLNNKNKLKLSFVSNTYMILNLPFGKIYSQISFDKLKISVGSHTINSNNFISIYDMGPWFYKDKVTGFFPMSYFGNNHVIYIDPKNNYLCFKDSLDNSQFSKISFVHNNSDVIAIQSTLDIRSKDISFSVAGTFLIDFGTPRDEIMINQTKMVGIEYKAEEGYEISANKDNPLKIQNLYADTARLLNFDNTYFRNLRISINQPTKNSPYETYAGVIGARILENYIVAIDYKSKYIYLKGLNKEIEIKENILYTKWGISLIPMPITNTADTTKCKWIVSSLKKTKKADVAGIKLWDELETMDNIPADQFSLTVGKNALKVAKKMTFKGQDGIIKTLEE
jgi:hypothetical protein